MNLGIPRASELTYRGLVTFGLVWQLAWMAADSRLWPTSTHSILASGLLAISWITWLILIVFMVGARWTDKFFDLVPRAARANIVALVAAAVALMVSDLDRSAGEWILAASLFNLASGMSGLIIRDPHQWRWVFTIVGTQTTVFIVAMASSDGFPREWSNFLYPTYALALGLASSAAQRGLIKKARETDRTLMDSIQIQSEDRIARELSQQQVRQQAKVHEVVLNTLIAISRGTTPRTAHYEKILRTSARESAEILHEIDSVPDIPIYAHHNGGVLDELSDLLKECSLRGMDVEFHGHVHEEIPISAREELLAAAREALVNLLRHSEGTKVSLTVHGSKSGDYSIVIADNGIGFDADGCHTGFGFSSILSPHDGHLSVSISSEVGRGTKVAIAYKNQDALMRRFFSRRLIPTSNIVSPLLVIWSLFSALQLIVSWTTYSNPLYVLMSFLIIVSLAIVAIVQSKSGFLPWWMVFLFAFIAPTAYLLEQSALEGTSISPWNEWTSEAIVALFFTVSAAGPWWAWMIVGASWLVTQGGFPQELMAPGFALVVSGAILGRALRRNNDRLQAAKDTVSSQLASSSLASLRSSARVARYQGVIPPETLNFLEEIASGERDPWTEPVKVQCAVEEAFLRNVLLIDPSVPLSFFTFIAELSSFARSQELVLETSINMTPGSTLPASRPMAQFVGLRSCLQELCSLLENSPVESSIRISLSGSTECSLIRMVRMDNGSPDIDAKDLLVSVNDQPPSRVSSYRDSDGTSFVTWERTICLGGAN